MLTVAYLLKHNARSNERAAVEQIEQRAKLMKCPANKTVMLYRKAMRGKGIMSKQAVMVAIKTKAVDINGVLTRLREHGYVQSHRRYDERGHTCWAWEWVGE